MRMPPPDLRSPSAPGVFPRSPPDCTFLGCLETSRTAQPSGACRPGPPPLRREGDYPAAADPRPKLVAVPEHDQFRSPSSARPILSTWVNTRVEVVKGADHFLVGRTDKAVELFLSF